MGSITPEQNVVGTLIVDIYGAKEKNLVWRGSPKTRLATTAARTRRWYRKPSRRCSNNILAHARVTELTALLATEMKEIRVTNQSHFTLAFPLKSPADAKAVAEQLPPMMAGLFQAEDTIGTIHYSRFTVLSEKTLLFLGDFDGEFG